MLIDDGPARFIGDFVSRFNLERVNPLRRLDGGVKSANSEEVFSTRALSRFLALLKDRESPVVVDLGSAVGANVTFFGEELKRKLFVDDLPSDFEAFLSTKDNEGHEPVLKMSHSDASVDGVLCWDVMEYLLPTAAKIVADEIARILRPNGVVFLCFGLAQRPKQLQTTYEIVNKDRIRYRDNYVAGIKRRVLHSREITQLFGRLKIIESVFLTNQMQEMVFRKSI